MDDAPIRWGVLGTGGIARSFVSDLRLLPDHAVVAVGSRRPESARAFADAHGAPRAHGSYPALAADPDVDVVYVATPHPVHREAALMCIDAGRAVLVEKPFAMTAAEAAEMVEAARRARVFCMEAMWTRFNPLVGRLRELVADGAIGEPRSVAADFGRAQPYDAAHRLFAPALGGGAVLDLGVYPVSFASMVLGSPASVHAVTGRAATGVDANTGILLGYASGAVAVLYCSLEAESPSRAAVSGTAGRIELPRQFHRPTSLELHRVGHEPERFDATLLGRGYTYQAAEVARCLRAGLIESPLMPLDETVVIMATLDTVLARLG